MATSKDQEKPEVQSESVDKLSDTVGTLFRKTLYSDMTLKCGAVDFPLHRAIVCPQSEFFASALEHDMKEKETGIIYIDDAEIDVVCAMLEFLYKRDYTFHAASEEPERSELSFHVKVYGLADKYFISALKTYVATKFRIRVAVAGNDEFVAAAEAITTSRYGNADGLRQTIAETLYKSRTEMVTNNPQDYESLRVAFGLGFEVMLVHAKELVAQAKNMKETPIAPIKLRCPRCSAIFYHDRRPDLIAMRCTTLGCNHSSTFRQLETEGRRSE